MKDDIVSKVSDEFMKENKGLMTDLARQEEYDKIRGLNGQLQYDLDSLAHAARELRQAQKDYMLVREKGSKDAKSTLGAIVEHKSRYLDKVLEDIEKNEAAKQ